MIDQALKELEQPTEKTGAEAFLQQLFHPSPLPPIVPPADRTTKVLVAGDMHFGKKTGTYNIEIFKKKMERVREDVKSRRQFTDEDLVIVILGDTNDGTGIFPTQQHHQEETNVEQQAALWADFAAGWVKGFLEDWGKVRLVLVAGNHGRSGKFSHEAANWDLVAYRYLSMKIPAEIPVEISADYGVFFHVTNIRGHRILLHHGNTINCYQNIPWYGMQTRMLRWQQTRFGPFAAMLMGHFHSSGIWTINNIDVILTGSPVSDDEFPLEVMGYEGDSCWWLLTSTDRKFIVRADRISMKEGN